MVFSDRFDDDERLFEFIVVSKVPFGFAIRGMDTVWIIASPCASKHDGFLWGLFVLFSICLIALFLLGRIALAYGDDDVDVSAVELAQFFKARGIVIFARFVILPRIECDDGIALFDLLMDIGNAFFVPVGLAIELDAYANSLHTAPVR